MKLALANSRRGMALLVVVVLTMLIALGAYRFSFYMESQYRLTRLHEEQVHARISALSGLEMAAFIAELPQIERNNLGGLNDNPAMLRHVAIGATSDIAARDEQATPGWRFGLISPMAMKSGNDSGQNLKEPLIDSTDGRELSNVRFGFENESAKLHIPTLLQWNRESPGQARMTLLALPGATEQLVDAWLRGLGVMNHSGRDNGGVSLFDLQEAGRESQAGFKKGSGTVVQSTRRAVPATVPDPFLNPGTVVQSTRRAVPATAPDPFWNLAESRIPLSDRGLLKTLWLGGDLNQNYRLDPVEVRLYEQLFNPPGGAAGSAVISLAASDSTMEAAPPFAWQRYLTWNSGQRNETRDGRPRVNLNEANLQALHQKLIAIWPADWANFAIALRQYGPNSTPAGETAAAHIESPSPDFTLPASFTFKSPLDLVGAVVQIVVTNPPSGSDGPNSATTIHRLRTPFSSDVAEVRNYLGRILDEVTTDAGPFTTGRIDVSEAPAEVLAGIPGIDADLARRIVQQRGSNSNSGASVAEPRDTIAWLLDGGAVDLEKLRTIEPYITSRNDVYSVQSVGYRDHLSPVYRCTATIDARRIPSQIHNFQIWHSWDRGFSMEQLSSSSQ